MGFDPGGLVSFARQLENTFRIEARQSFDNATRATLEALRNQAPRDSGQLRQGLVLRDRTVTGQVMAVTLASTAQEQGFDYPEHINRVDRIAPSRRKYLRFTTPQGATVFSKGFPNPNQGWWDEAWSIAQPPTLWDRQIRAQFGGAS